MNAAHDSQLEQPDIEKLTHDLKRLELQRSELDRNEVEVVRAFIMRFNPQSDDQFYTLLSHMSKYERLTNRELSEILRVNDTTLGRWLSEDPEERTAPIDFRRADLVKRIKLHLISKSKRLERFYSHDDVPANCEMGKDA